MTMPRRISASRGTRLVYRFNRFTLIDTRGSRGSFTALKAAQTTRASCSKGQLPTATAMALSRSIRTTLTIRMPIRIRQGTISRGFGSVETVDGTTISYAYVFAYETGPDAQERMSSGTLRRKVGSGLGKNYGERCLPTTRRRRAVRVPPAAGLWRVEPRVTCRRSPNRSTRVVPGWRPRVVLSVLPGGGSQRRRSSREVCPGTRGVRTLGRRCQVTDPLSASDEKVAEYAALYFGVQRGGEITKRQVAGSLASTFEREDSGYEGTDYNS